MPDALYMFDSQPGVRRDGTNLDTPYYNDAVWVRWQRGRPRKMGGYRSMSTHANGPVRAVFLDSRGGVNSTHLFSQWGIQRVQFANDGSAGIIEDRTPLAFASDPLLNWSHDSMYSSTGGAYSAIIASSSPDVEDIASDTPGYVYAGNIATNDPLTAISDGSGNIRTSGGICVLQPFLVVYGSNGLIRNSNTNDFSTATGWTTGGPNFASTGNYSGTKVIYGAPLRGGGQSPAGLFWSLDSLIRHSFVGGTAIWSTDTLAKPTTVLSKKAIVEVDGKFFWPGTDRFLHYNGVVQELPNAMSQNWFFDNLNYTYQNKVWGTKVARWGEIWWFYPRGTDTECGHAVIFNYRENTWYDAVKERTAGAPTSVFAYPIWAGHEDAVETMKLTTGVRLQTSAATAAGSAVLTFTDTTGVVDGMVASGSDGIPNGTTVLSHNATTITLTAVTTGAGVLISTVLSFTSMTTAFAEGYTVTGGTSGAVGTAQGVLTTAINVKDITGTFVSGETITGQSSATAVIQSDPESQQQDVQYQQEFGFDKTVGQDTTAIEASFVSRSVGFAIAGPIDDVPKTLDMLTRTMRFEPDFNQVGDMTIEVQGRSFAQDDMAVLSTQTFTETSSFVDLTDQARIMQIKITSNTLGGFFEQGQVMIKLEPGDERATKAL
jgi:hypothetical protein